MAFDPIAYALAKKSAKQYTDTAISNIGTNMTYKGNVASSANLPLSGNKKGDVWTTTDTGAEYVWTLDASSGQLSDWQELGKISGYTVTFED